MSISNIQIFSGVCTGALLCFVFIELRKRSFRQKGSYKKLYNVYGFFGRVTNPKVTASVRIGSEYEEFAIIGIRQDAVYLDFRCGSIFFASCLKIPYAEIFPVEFFQGNKIIGPFSDIASFTNKVLRKFDQATYRFEFRYHKDLYFEVQGRHGRCLSKLVWERRSDGCAVDLT
jgi:hypothetical protein